MCVTDSKYSEPNGDGVMKIAKIMANNGKKNPQNPVQISF